MLLFAILYALIKYLIYERLASVSMGSHGISCVQQYELIVLD